MTQHLLLGNNVKINTKKIKSAYQKHNLVLKVHGNGKENLDCSKLKFATGDTVMIFARSEVNGKVHKIDLCNNYIENPQTYQIFQDVFKQKVNIELFTNNADLVTEDVKYLPNYSSLATLNGPTNPAAFDTWGEYMMLSIFDVLGL